jgi:hypothetical protein
MVTTEPITVIETPSFLRDSKGLLDDDEREALVGYLAYNPRVGRIVVGTGGIRKVRWARENEGKSGGYRVVYFHHSEEVPLFTLNVFAKNEKMNLTKEERNSLKKLTAVLVENYRRKEKKK